MLNKVVLEKKKDQVHVQYRLQPDNIEVSSTSF